MAVPKSDRTPKHPMYKKCYDLMGAAGMGEAGPGEGEGGGEDEGEGEGVCGCEDGTNFCNYDFGDDGTCEPCSTHGSIDDCDNDGATEAGAQDCKNRCFGDGGSSSEGPGEAEVTGKGEGEGGCLSHIFDVRQAADHAADSSVCATNLPRPGLNDTGAQTAAAWRLPVEANGGKLM